MTTPKILYIIATGAFTLLSACSGGKSASDIIVKGQKLDCNLELIRAGTDAYLRESYFSYKNEEFLSLPDGEYKITVDAIYKNGNLDKKRTTTLPYQKSGANFSPKWSAAFWDQNGLDDSEAKLLGDGAGSFSCSIREIGRRDDVK